MSNRHEKRKARIHGMMTFDKGSMARGDHLMASLYHKLEIEKEKQVEILLPVLKATSALFVLRETLYKKITEE